MKFIKKKGFVRLTLSVQFPAACILSVKNSRSSNATFDSGRFAKM